ncbi:MAG: nuclear transport factor 2 family protein [Acidobacteriota bacterium]
MEADRAFGAASAEAGLAGWLSFFAEDASIFPPRGPIITGLPAIREHYAQTGFSPEGLRWTPLAARAAASGDLGYTFGTWEKAGAAGAPAVARGKYVTIWRLVEGNWKVVADVGNADLPPQANATNTPAPSQ